MKTKLILVAALLATSAMATTTVATTASAPVTKSAVQKVEVATCVPVTCPTTKAKAKPKAKPVAAAPAVDMVIVPVDKVVVVEKTVLVEKVVVQKVEVPTALPVQAKAWKLEGDYLYDFASTSSGLRVQVDTPYSFIGITPVAQYDYVPNVYQRIGMGVQYPVARLENTQFLVTGRGFYQDTANAGSNTGGGGVGVKMNTTLTPKVSFVAGAEYNWIGSGKDGAVMTVGLNYAF